MRYYKSSTRKRDSTKCHKAPIRKEIPEQLIADTTVKVLDNPEAIDLIANRVLEAHENRLRDTAVINILEAERDRIRKALKKVPRLMIKLLVKEVILYDDKVEIYYNCIDKKGLMTWIIRSFVFIGRTVRLTPKSWDLGMM